MSWRHCILQVLGILRNLLRDTLNEGWDMVLIDSLEVVAGRIQLTTGLNKSQSLKWVMDLMFKHKRGNNPTNTYTTFLAVQQATKKGIFKGDSSIEFDTSGMLYIKRGANNERHLIFTKNRRGPSNISLFYRLGDGKSVRICRRRGRLGRRYFLYSSCPIMNILKALALKEFGQKIGINTSFEILKEVEDALDKSVTKQ